MRVREHVAVRTVRTVRTVPTMKTVRLVLAVLTVLLAPAVPVAAQAPVQYTLSFPEPHQRWMQVEVVFPDLPPGPLQVRMSRTSPGRYALHEFAKNVYSFEATDGAGNALPVSRVNPHQWDMAGHDGTVRVRYRIYGDRVDGTYLGIDSTHAHINMPAALMWARGLDRRPVRVTFVQPAGKAWHVATQLMPTADPLVFTAPNLQYLLDSPAEFSAAALHTFAAPRAEGDTGKAPTIRVSLHHTGSDADAKLYVDGVKRVVEQARRLFGEYPRFENDTYTFLADYLPWASGDGMEHRNSTVLSSRGSLPASRLDLLGTVSHEFIHAWNVERIRPRSLEPFNFEEANMSGELWLAEGVTSYYDDLLLARAGLIELPALLDDLTAVVGAVVQSPATALRSAEDMSRVAPFVDAASWIDRTNWPNTYISYYVYGAALGFGLDLSIREKTGNRKSLDDVMRALWVKHGKPGGRETGYVDVPYTSGDVRDRIAEVTGDPAFAAELMRRYVQGREVMDYASLVQQAGLVMRSRLPGRASLGVLPLAAGSGGVRVEGPTLIGSAAYRAGIAQDDEITAIGDAKVATTEQVDAVLRKHKPGDTVRVTFTRRGETVRADVVLEEDPRIEIVTLESTGKTPSAAQKALRDAWLSGR
jgi:predicted metalloprotease with PDZ domain